MKRFANLFALAVFVSVGSIAEAQTDGLQPVKPEAVAASAKSCAGAVSATGVNEQQLSADGWSEGKLTSEGKQVESPLRFLSRDHALLLLLREDGKPSSSCVILARIESRQDYQRAVEATQAALQGRVARSENGKVVWLLQDGKAAQIEVAGTNDKPSVRVAVMQLPKEN